MTKSIAYVGALAAALLVASAGTAAAQSSDPADTGSIPGSAAADGENGTGAERGSGAGAEQSAAGAEGRGRRAWRQLLGCRAHDQHGRGAALGQVRQRSLSLAAAGQDYLSTQPTVAGRIPTARHTEHALSDCSL